MKLGRPGGRQRAEANRVLLHVWITQAGAIATTSLMLAVSVIAFDIFH